MQVHEVAGRRVDMQVELGLASTFIDYSFESSYCLDFRIMPELSERIGRSNISITLSDGDSGIRVYTLAVVVKQRDTHEDSEE